MTTTTINVNMIPEFLAQMTVALEGNFRADGDNNNCRVEFETEANVYYMKLSVVSGIVFFTECWCVVRNKRTRLEKELFDGPLTEKTWDWLQPLILRHEVLVLTPPLLSL